MKIEEKDWKRTVCETDRPFSISIKKYFRLINISKSHPSFCCNPDLYFDSWSWNIILLSP